MYNNFHLIIPTVHIYTYEVSPVWLRWGPAGALYTYQPHLHVIVVWRQTSDSFIYILIPPPKALCLHYTDGCTVPVLISDINLREGKHHFLSVCLWKAHTLAQSKHFYPWWLISVTYYYYFFFIWTDLAAYLIQANLKG